MLAKRKIDIELSSAVNRAVGRPVLYGTSAAGTEYASKYLRIFIRGNGCGISPDFLNDGREGHLGLSGMRGFAEKIG